MELTFRDCWKVHLDFPSFPSKFQITTKFSNSENIFLIWKYEMLPLVLFLLKNKQTKCAFLYQLIDGIFSHHPFNNGNNILHTYRTKAMDWFKAHRGLSFSSIDILCWFLQYQEILHIWKLLCYNVEKQFYLMIGVIFSGTRMTDFWSWSWWHRSSSSAWSWS